MTEERRRGQAPRGGNEGRTTADEEGGLDCLPVRVEPGGEPGDGCTERVPGGPLRSAEKQHGGVWEGRHPSSPTPSDTQAPKLPSQQPSPAYSPNPESRMPSCFPDPQDSPEWRW